MAQNSLNKLAKIGSIAAALFYASLAWAEAPSITVVVTPNPVEESQSIQLRIEVSAPLAAAVFQPQFEAPDFILVGSQPNYGGMTMRQYVNGKEYSSKNTFFEYVLSPKKAGNFSIKNIRVKVANQEYRSPDQNVKVLPDSGGPRVNPQPSNEEEDESSNPASPYYSGKNLGVGQDAKSLGDKPKQFNSDFTVHAAISKTEAYVGEPIIAEYWLYDFGALRQMEVQKWPTFNGFWKDDLEIATRFEFDEVFEQNQVMRKAFLGRYALYGIKPGKIDLDKLVVRGQYVSGTTNRGFFSTEEYRTGIHGSQEMQLTILPLPAEGKPEKFSGAVGQFSVKIAADKSSVAQHSPINITVLVEGKGNFQAIDSVPLVLPTDFESYDKKTVARGSAPIGASRNLESSKAFQITAIPRKAGKFRIESFEFNYFDPQKKSYQKVSSQPLEIEVTPAEDMSAGKNSYDTSSGTPAATPKESLRPLMNVPEKVGKSWWTYSLVLAAFLNLLLALRWLKKGSGKYLELFQDSLDPVKENVEKLKSSENWVGDLEEVVYQLFSVLLGTTARGLTKLDLEHLWKEQQLPPQILHQLSGLLDEVDQMRFAREKNTSSLKQKKNAIPGELEKILQELISHRKKKR